MRVITGKAKGKKLVGPKSNAIRPAIDSVKESIFNILGNIEGASVLDLFAGTGSIGIEALSRGASKATFVDNNSEAIQLIKKNLKITDFSSNAVIIKNSCNSAIQALARRGEQFDLIFVDPPYDKGLVGPAIQKIVKHKILKPAGLIIIEHSPREKVPENLSLEITSERKYGQTRVTFLKERGNQ